MFHDAMSLPHVQYVQNYGVTLVVKSQAVIFLISTAWSLQVIILQHIVLAT